MAPASLPASGSVTANAASFLPDAISASTSSRESKGDKDFFGISYNTRETPSGLKSNRITIQSLLPNGFSRKEIKSSSLRILISKPCAFFNLEPAPGPATR